MNLARCHPVCPAAGLPDLLTYHCPAAEFRKEGGHVSLPLCPNPPFLFFFYYNQVLSGTTLDPSAACFPLSPLISQCWDCVSTHSRDCACWVVSRALGQ